MAVRDLYKYMSSVLPRHCIDLIVRRLNWYYIFTTSHGGVPGSLLWIFTDHIYYHPPAPKVRGIERIFAPLVKHPNHDVDCKKPIINKCKLHKR